MAIGDLVIGVRPYSFKPADRDGEVLEGITLWLGAEQKDAIGLIPYKVSVSKAKMKDILERAEVSDISLLVNSYVECVYDRYGKLSALEVVAEP